MPQTKCKHCKNKKDRAVMVGCDSDDSIYFCCNGCKSIYLLLNDKDKEKRDKPKSTFISKLKKILKIKS
jgi:hypothetical protein